MRKWLDTFGPDKNELLVLLTAGSILVSLYVAYVVHLWRTGGDVKAALAYFAVAFAIGFIPRR